MPKASLFVAIAATMIGVQVVSGLFLDVVLSAAVFGVGYMLGRSTD